MTYLRVCVSSWAQILRLLLYSHQIQRMVLLSSSFLRKSGFIYFRSLRASVQVLGDGLRTVWQSLPAYRHTGRPVALHCEFKEVAVLDECLFQKTAGSELARVVPFSLR